MEIPPFELFFEFAWCYKQPLILLPSLCLRPPFFITYTSIHLSWLDVRILNQERMSNFVRSSPTPNHYCGHSHPVLPYPTYSCTMQVQSYLCTLYFMNFNLRHTNVVCFCFTWLWLRPCWCTFSRRYTTWGRNRTARCRVVWCCVFLTCLKSKCAKFVAMKDRREAKMWIHQLHIPSQVSWMISFQFRSSTIVRWKLHWQGHVQSWFIEWHQILGQDKGGWLGHSGNHGSWRKGIMMDID